MSFVHCQHGVCPLKAEHLPTSLLLISEFTPLLQGRGEGDKRPKISFKKNNLVLKSDTVPPSDSDPRRISQCVSISFRLVLRTDVFFS